MKLSLIPHETCPQCGSRTVAESCYTFHCNRQGNEERRFECGCVLRWSPNFERLETIAQCPKSPEMVARNNLRKKAKSALALFIHELDVDEQWKAEVSRATNYI